MGPLELIAHNSWAMYWSQDPSTNKGEGVLKVSDPLHSRGRTDQVRPEPCEGKMSEEEQDSPMVEAAVPNWKQRNIRPF